MNSIKQSYHHIQLDEQSQSDLLNRILTTEPQRKQHQKVIPLIMVLSCFIIAFVFSSFQASNESPFIESTPNKTTSSQLSELPQDLTLEQMKDKGFYINMQRTMYNQEVMNQFIKDTQNKVSASIIIAIYSIEGKICLNEVIYQDNKVIVYFDGTRNDYGYFPEITKHKYENIGVYDNNLYAYNGELSDAILTQDSHDNCYYLGPIK